jgi:flagellar basal-body rod modification protein FlgD
MLTTQMQNQDPLNPVQSSDFAVQLATFSGVEQQVRTNDLLAGLSSSLGGTALAQFADWVGKEVRSPAGARFDGSPITVSAPALADAETAELLVRDQSGRIVDRRPVALQGGEVTWDGIAQTGDRFLTGHYSFAVEGRAQGQALYERPVEVYATVSEARVNPSGAVELVLDGGATVAPDLVSALRQPSG